MTRRAAALGHLPPANRQSRIRGVHWLGVCVATVLASIVTPMSNAAVCELRLLDHRSGRELLRTASASTQLRVAFTHSVLGTPVEDRYLWRAGAWRLVEERFDGEGYGLPHAAAAGEQLVRDGRGWRLLLDREVAPLVVRSLPAQQMRVLLDDGRAWPLADLGAPSVEIRLEAC